MAIHAQKQLRSVLAFALAILAGTLIVRNFALSGSSQRTAATQVDLTAARVTAHRFNHDASGLIDLSPRLEYLRLVETYPHQGTGRNIFQVEVENLGEKVVHRDDPIEPKLPPAVVPIPLPLKFFGYSRNGNTRSIFLLKETDIFIASEGDIVDRRYKIVRIAHNSAQVEDLLSTQRQELWFRETP